MKTIRQSWRVLAISLLVALLPQGASAKNLAVNRVAQVGPDSNGNTIGNEWCWAACSKMILDYYGYPKTLPEIVTYGLGDAKYDTWNYMWGSGTESRTKVAIWEENTLLGIPLGTYTLKSKTIPALAWNGIDKILKNFSNNGDIQTQQYAVAIAADQITKEIDDNDAPFVVRIGWDSGGGHFTVCYGTNAGTHSIHDPLFGSYVVSDAIQRRGALGTPASNYTWTHTLTTSKILDVVFLFDTTSSMSDDIANAKASATTLLNNISTKFKNYRVAVANYRDFPQSPYGETSDYLYIVNQPFTKDKAAAQTAINSLVTGGGRDWPESVYTALSNSMDGVGLADAEGKTWRDNPARRIIVMIGDAPGHDPEPWAGGSSFGAVLTKALTPAKPIAVHCLLVGFDIDAGNQFALIGGGSGGSVTNASNASEVGPGLQAIVDSVAESPRFPKLKTGSIYPTFTFDPVGTAGMASDATSLLIEIQKFDEKKNAWKKLRVVTIKDPLATVYTSKLPFAVGKYRWRLGFKRPSGKLFIPSLNKTITTPGKSTYEPEYTEFDREENEPGPVTLLTPPSFFTATETKVEFKFGVVPGATSYVLQVRQGTKVVKKYTLKPSKKEPDAPSLTKIVSGLKTGESYSWRVQALNYDRPKVDDNAW